MALLWTKSIKNSQHPECWIYIVSVASMCCPAVRSLVNRQHPTISPCRVTLSCCEWPCLKLFYSRDSLCPINEGGRGVKVLPFQTIVGVWWALLSSLLGWPRWRLCEVCIQINLSLCPVLPSSSSFHRLLTPNDCFGPLLWSLSICFRRTQSTCVKPLTSNTAIFI